ncbi:MAG: NAD(P)/FAD-dependent oxidoreductase [Haliscomenobacter sp.]|uniref:NAD(P)/FAD-dependent oxidoreductase n=1 Tax=Haliscomenobacter sp. TaxID=2717303 RepID=UPI00299FB976|nr:NAD(P)/FAD-dependent oxidoreductase [Haliscomenobacter sp.]MDX2067554.1 NAD(P)/FAD-dependent oxidoreductase [Haliscomenobacter sp.]
MNQTIIIIGGGAAGFFTAIRAAECAPGAQVIILEKSKDVLGKVKVSGGGRCNLTHACFIPRELSKFYPRGEKELLGPFNRFACGDTIDWFEKRGVATKIEEDGRMFPTSDDSQTVIDCLWSAARKAGVKVYTNTPLKNIKAPTQAGKTWVIETSNQTLHAHKVMMATGSAPSMWDLLAKLGHQIVPPVPSLFTFNIKDARLSDLLGVSVPLAEVQVEGQKLRSSGPLLITHWGLSGPAILKLSAWGARELAALNYRFVVRVNWIMSKTESTREDLEELKQEDGRKMVMANAQFGLANRLWKRLVQAAGIREDKRWADLSKKEIQALAEELTQGRFQVNGKSTFKEEFVTAGGVDLKEVDFKTFESKLFPGLFFAGEVLNIDAITGGFNFQAAWTGGWIAGEAMSKLER